MPVLLLCAEDFLQVADADLDAMFTQVGARGVAK